MSSNIAWMALLSLLIFTVLLVFLVKERFEITLRSSRRISDNGRLCLDQACAIRSLACCRYPARTILQVVLAFFSTKVW